MSPETWADILYTYGPNAVLVFCVFIIEKKVRSAWRAADKDNQREQTFFRRLYGLTWIFIFGVAICSIYLWGLINVSRRPQITGIVESLPNSEILHTTFADLYLHKNPKGPGYSDYDILLINKDYKQWANGHKVKFTIQTPRPNSREDDLYEYVLPIQSAFYKTGVVLRRRGNLLLLDHNNKEDELEWRLLPADEVPESTRVEPTWSLLPTAYAQPQQSGFSSYEFTVGLESPDVIVRRKTRQDLSLQDQTLALP